MVVILITRHLPEWADILDYSTLALKSTEVIARNFKVRRIDLVWTCRTKDGARELVLVLELQRDSCSGMATRAMVYAGLAVQQERKRRPAPGEVRPRYRAKVRVLHHGDGEWTASRRPVELLGDKASEDCYEVVSPLPFGTPEPEVDDLPQIVLGLARSMPDEQAAAEVRRLRSAVDLDGDPDLDEAVVPTMKRMLELMGVPYEVIEEVDTVHAGAEVLERSLEATARRNVEKGWRAGRREGRMAERRRLCFMAARKFDAATARELAGLLDRVADPDRLNEVAEAIIDCDGGEELLVAVRRVLAG